MKMAEFSKSVENTVGKGRNCPLRGISLFPEVFSTTCTVDTNKQGLVWEKVKSLANKNFGVDQLERICRRQNKCDLKIKICLRNG